MDDLTTRARLRDAAIVVFGRDGFTATIRTIADEADVSAALVIHHFGTKDAMRAACDAHVFELTKQRNAAVLVAREDGPSGPPPAFGAQLAGLEQAGPSLMYLLRSIQQGGDLARAFIDRLVADTEESMSVGVANGVLRPSVDEAARARYLVAQSLGAMLVDLVMNPPADHADSGAIMRSYVERTMVPAAEYATHGVLTDSSMLDAVLEYSRSAR